MKSAARLAATPALPEPLRNAPSARELQNFVGFYLQTTRYAAIFFNLFVALLLILVVPVRHFGFGLPLFPAWPAAVLEWGVMVPLTLVMAWLRWGQLSPYQISRWSRLCVIATFSAMVLDIREWRMHGIAIPTEYAGLFFLGLLSVSALPIRTSVISSLAFVGLSAASYGYFSSWTPDTGFEFYFDLVAAAFALLNAYTLRQEAVRAWALRLQLNEFAYYDPLTGLANRRYLGEIVTARFAQAQRDGLPIGLAVADLDHFKELNDTLGHDAGDEALKTMAACLQKVAARPMDLAARLGGDEFLVLWYGTDAAQCEDLGRRLRELLTGARIPSQAGTDRLLSTSVGIACGVPSTGKGFDQFRHVADQELYRVKRARPEYGVRVVAV